MPRYREPFTVFPRKLSSGKTVYYYRTYTPDGKRTTAHSTGKTSKAQARCYCAELMMNGTLYSDSMLFRDYADDFFGDNSQWMQDKRLTGKGKLQPVAKNTLSLYRGNLRLHLMPYFSKMKLCDIKPYDIKRFMEKLADDKLSNSTINSSCNTLKIIVSYAVSDGYIKLNPFSSVKMMFINARSKDAFTEQELVHIIKHIKGDEKIMLITAAVTGMRLSEIMALRSDTLYPNYIDVKDQIQRHELVPVKTSEFRKVRICDSLYNLLKSKEGFIFTDEKDHYSYILKKYSNIGQAEWKKRKLSFHSIRHFLNTYLLVSGIAEIKVKSVMGHSSGKGSMTERYTNFKPEHFDDVALVQEKLISLFLR